MITIQVLDTGSFKYFEALFLGGNLVCFSLEELLKQLKVIYNITIDLLTFNLN